MPRYDYRCENGHIIELRRGTGVESVPCPECGEVAERVPFYASVELVTATGVGTGYGRYKPVGSEITDRNGRTRVSLFQEASAEVAYAHEKREQEVGHKLPSKSLYKEGLRRARAIEATGHEREA